jgi:hypothetical protein
MVDDELEFGMMPSDAVDLRQQARWRDHDREPGTLRVVIEEYDGKPQETSVFWPFRWSHPGFCRNDSFPGVSGFFRDVPGTPCDTMRPEIGFPFSF